MKGNQDSSWADKVVLITGGATGIGKGIAMEMYGKGAAVVIAGRNAETGQEAADSLGARAIYIQMDVRDTSSVNTTVNHIIRTFGRLDILVNNAGIPRSTGIETELEDQWDNVINTNLNGYARCVRAALPFLKESCGNILNIASLVGAIGMENSSSYVASKGGIIAFTKSLALDLAKYGIRVNAILPGWIMTENVSRMHPDRLKLVIDAHPLGRIGTPKDCGKAACYLCSEDASFITGISLAVDGGIALGYGAQIASAYQPTES
ncbi:MAG: SDR family oxidoreductase [Clostridiales bacterium]|nr:SDR family oxidoreductase [Clostridiales bacterium]